MKTLPLYAIVFFAFMGTSMILLGFTSSILAPDSTLLPADTTLSTRTLYLGILLAMSPLGQLFGAPILGTLSDKWGRRPLIFSTLFLTAISYIIIANSLTPFSLITLTIFLFIAGFSTGNVTVAQSALADTSEGQARTIRFGYVTMVASVGFVIGPVIASILTDSSIVSWFNPSTPFWVLAASFFFFTIWVLSTFKETLLPEKRITQSVKESLKSLAKIGSEPSLKPLFILNLITFIGTFGFCRLYPQFLVNHFQISHQHLCYAVVNFDFPIILVTLFAIRPLIKRYHLYSLYKAATTFLIIGTLLILAAPTFTWTWLFIYPVAIGHGIVMPVTTSLISQGATPTQQGVALGTNTSLLVISQLIAAMMGMGLTQIHLKLPLTIVCGVLILALYRISTLSRNLQKE